MYNIVARKQEFDLFVAEKTALFKGINNNRHLRSYVYFSVDNNKYIWNCKGTCTDKTNLSMRMPGRQT
jgi:hypothetical protein